MKKQTKNKKYVLMVLVVLLLGLAVGYAAFSDVLHISGSANAYGTFDVQFTSCTINTANSRGYNTSGADATGATISADGKTLTVTVDQLAYPGAGVQFDTVITNVGSIPATVKGLSNRNNEEGAGVFVIDGLTLPGDHATTLNQLDTCQFSFVVYWDPESTTQLTADNHEISFTLDIEYEQDTTPFTGVANHTV